MIDLLRRFSQRYLHWRRPLLIAVAVATVGVLLSLLSDRQHPLSTALIPSLLLLLWSLTGYLVLVTFPQLPGPPGSRMPLLQRWLIHCQRALYSLLALVLLLLSLATSWLSLRLLLLIAS